MTITPPPPMESRAAVAAGRRAVRRRAGWAGAGLTAVLVAGTSVAVGAGWHATGGQRSSAATVPLPAATKPVPAPTAPGPTPSKPTWPTEGDGRPQQDATARSGVRYEQGVKLLGAVSRIVPSGWSQPTGQTAAGIPLQDHQAQVAGDFSGHTWDYLASVAVRADGRTGRLLAEVHTPGNGLPTGPCPLAEKFWNMKGECQVVTVGAAKVGVVVRPTGDGRIDQWAAYRWPDGTVVYTAQSRNAANVASELPPLSALPLTVQQLAAAAVDPGFHLS